MSNSIRFLGLAVFAWAGVRAASLGLLPGTEPIATSAAATAMPEEAGIPPLGTTRFEPPRRLPNPTRRRIITRPTDHQARLMRGRWPSLIITRFRR